MGEANPYKSPQRHQAGSASIAARRSRTSHIVGVFALTWSVVAWGEWFLIPVFFPASGPVPHLAFAPQAILLFLGCVAITLIAPLWAIGTRCWWVLLYAVPAAAYVLFQVSRAI